jgi:PAS domain S-box-containing protein
MTSLPQPESSSITRWIKTHVRIPLRLILIGLFVLLTIGTVGVVEHLCFRNGQEAVENLANQLLQNVSGRVELYLKTYLQTPLLVNQLNANAVLQGQLDLQNPAQLEQHLWTQLNQFDTLSSIQVGNSQQDFRAIVRDNGLRLLQANATQPTQVKEYQLDDAGRKTTLLRTNQQPGVREQPWYQAALFTGKPTWGRISQLNDAQSISLTALQSIYDPQGEVRGVFSSAIFLNTIDHFLHQLPVGQSGEVFIIEQSGWSIATSNRMVSKHHASGDRFNLINSPASIEQAAARSLIDRFGDFSQIDSSQQLIFFQQGQRYFLQVIPFQDGYGLNWLIGVIVPESDFMGQIQIGTRRTVLLCTGVVAASVLAGLWAAGWITRSIEQLSQASLALARGEWDRSYEHDSLIAEVQMLMQSFHHTATRLQRSLDYVKTALHESEEKFTQVFRTCPDPIAILTLDGRYLDINDAFLELFGCSRDTTIGGTLTEVGPWDTLAEQQCFLQLMQSGQPVRNLEINLRNQAGQLLTVLLSADHLTFEGQPYLVTIAKNISDRKQAELELQQQKTLRETIYNEAADAIFLVDPQTWLIRDCNRRAVELFAAGSKAELLSIEVQSLQHQPLTAAKLSQIMISLDQKGCWNQEIEYINRTGQIFWGYLTIKPITLASQPFYLVRITDVNDLKQTEKALRQSEERIRAMLTTIPDLMTLVSADGTYLDVVRGNKLIDLVPADINPVGKPLTELLPPDVAARQLQLLERAIATGEIQTVEQKVWMGDRWQYEELRAVACSENAALVMIRNITDRKQAEADRQQAETALRQSEQLFRNAFEANAFGTNICSLEGNYLWVNPAFCQMLGYSEAELLQLTYEDVTHPDDIPNNPSFRVLAGELPYCLFEKRYVHKTGRIIWVSISISVVRDDQQQPLHFIAHVQDITNRKQAEFERQTAEAALRQSEATKNEILKAIPDLLIWMTADGDYIMIDGDGSLNLYKGEEAIGKNLRDVLPADLAETRMTAIQQALQTGQVQVYEQQFLLRDRIHYEEVRVVGVSEDRVLLIVRDINDRKRAEFERQAAEEALRRSEATKNQILRAIPDLIMWMSADGVYLERIDGEDVIPVCSSSESIGKTVYDILPPDAAQTKMSMIQRAIQTNKMQVYEHQLTIQGQIQHEEVRLIGVGEDRVLVIVRNITDRKQAEVERQKAEAALRQSEATKNQILKAIPDLIIWMTANGVCIDLIDGEGAMNVCANVDVIGTNMNDLLPPELVETRRNAVQQAIQTGEMQIYEQQLTLTDGGHFEEVRVVSVGEDRVLVIVRDITDRKRTEAALLDSETRSRNAFQNAPIGMALIGLDDRWIRVNPMLCEMLGYSEAELFLTTASSLVHPNDQDKLNQCNEHVLSGSDRNAQAELRYCCREGRIAWGFMSLSLVRDAQAQPLYYVAQIQDITERQAIDRMKNEFISIVSHELRTPLTAIRGFLGLLNTGMYDNKPERAKHMLQQALINSDRLVRLVNDILNLERLSSGRAQFVLEICDAQTLLHQATAGLQSIAEEAGITLVTLPTTAQIWADSDAILQTLTNLLSNAIKFSPVNSAVALSVQETSEWVLFSVADQGRGIPADKLETIFGRFQQVDVSDSRQKGGTGLGLAICKSIIQQHNGHIWVESLLGEGSTFYFTLPLPPRGNHSD